MAESNFIDAKKAVDQLTEALRLHMEVIDKSVVSLNKLNKEYTDLPSDYVRTQKQLLDLRRQEERAQQELIKTQQQLERLKQQEKKTDQDIERVKQQGLRTDQQIERSKQQQQRTLATESRTRQTLIREQEQQRRITERERKSVERSNSAYMRLRDSLNKAEKEYRELGATLGVADKRTKEARKEVVLLRKQLDSINKPIGRMTDNVGNYGSAWKSAGRFMTGAIAAMGLYSGIEIARQLYADIKAVNSMNMSLQQITQTTEAYARAKSFLRRVSEESGVEIISLTQTYTKFLAAAENTNLTIRETEDIFSTVAKAGSLLGLSTESVEGAFRALEQMLSKGNVQAEEIRGQLGERLPGSFQILAKSMGLTTQELNKQLELGNVLAEEVLPKFAKELEKTYSLEKIDRVQSLVAEQNRLSNSWIGFVETLSSNEGTITEILSGTLGLVRGVVEGMRQLNLGAEGRNREVSEEVFNNVLKNQLDYYKQIGDQAKSIAMIDSQSSARRRNEYESQLELLKQTNSQLEDQNENMGFNPVKYHLNKKAISDNKDVIDELTVSIARENATLRASSEILAGNNDALDNNTKKTDDNNKKKKEAKIILEGSLSSYEQTIKNLEDEQSRLATNSRDYGNYTAKINEAKEALALFKVQLNGVNEIDLDLDKTKALADFFKSLEDSTSSRKSRTDEINQGIKDELDEQRRAEAEKTRIIENENQRRIDIVFGSLEQFGEAYGVDLGAFRALFDKKKNTIADYASAAQEVLSFALNQRLSGYDLELEKAAQTRDQILDNERSSEKQRQAAERQYAKEEARIKNERAKKERENALIQVAVNTAIGITQALATVPPPASFVLAGVIAAMGGLQAGLIASQPLPKFEKGTDNAPRGWAVVDEKGPELHTDKSGNIKSTGSSKGANLRYLEKGDKIYPHGTNLETDEMMSLQNMLWNAGINLSSPAKLEKDDSVLNELKGLRKDNKGLKKSISSIANRPINVTINDKPNPYYG